MSVCLNDPRVLNAFSVVAANNSQNEHITVAILKLYYTFSFLIASPHDWPLTLITKTSMTRTNLYFYFFAIYIPSVLRLLPVMPNLQENLIGRWEGVHYYGDTTRLYDGSLLVTSQLLLTV